MPQSNIIDTWNEQIEQFGLIYDRTIADVNLVLKLYSKGWENMTDEEKAQWSNDLKGALNISDLNRVESVCEWLNEQLKHFGYDQQLSIKKDWQETDFMEEQTMADYCSNVSKVISAIPNNKMADIPSNTNNITYMNQNDIEKDLYLMRDVIVTLAEGMKVLSFTLSGDEF